MYTVLESYIHIVKKKSNRNKRRNKIASNRKRKRLDSV